MRTTYLKCMGMQCLRKPNWTRKESSSILPSICSYLTITFIRGLFSYNHKVKDMVSVLETCRFKKKIRLLTIPYRCHSRLEDALKSFVSLELLVLNKPHDVCCSLFQRSGRVFVGVFGEQHRFLAGYVKGFAKLLEFGPEQKVPQIVCAFYYSVEDWNINVNAC